MKAKLGGGDASSLLEGLSMAFLKARNVRITTGELELLDALNSPDFDMSTTAVSKIRELGQALTELVIKDSGFFGDSPRLVLTDNGAMGFYPDYVGFALLRRALQLASPEAALEWFRKVSEAKFATGKTIRALWGVPVREEIQLAPEVKIVPIENLPDSLNKRSINDHWFIRRGGMQVTTMLDFTTPQSALVADRIIEPFLFDPNNPPDVSHEEYDKICNLFKEITLVLTVQGPRVSLSAAQWFTFDDPDLEEANMLSGGRMWESLEILPSRPVDYPVLDAAEAKKIVHDYFKLQGDTRGKVRVALQRLNLALRRGNIGDRAVELSIAFETLLGDKATNEMMHKIKVRAVRLIGGTEEARRRNAKIINEAYSIRSKLVHTGHVDIDGGKTIGDVYMSWGSIIDHTISMCSNLIRIIISRGSVPDWSVFDISDC